MLENLRALLFATLPVWLLWWLASLLICLPFIVSVIDKLLHRPAALDEMAAGGFPRSSTLLAAVIALQAAGVALVLAGWHRALGALLLGAFLLAATLVYHRFWREHGAQRIAKLNHFAENLALIGALGLIAIAG
jgi:putative oxidoreductase